jgi:Protein of unknown function (DUF3306)
MNDSDNFLTRWSRRKSEQQRDAKRGEKSEPDTLASPETAPEQDATAELHDLPKAASGKPPAFDPASLPPIESIGANTDIRAFLQPGVPADIRNAALRRAWSVDPAIRTFKGLQENDWDFNDPNGIPGFGPLDPGLDVKKMALALFGKARDELSTPGAAGQGPRAEPVHVAGTDEAKTSEAAAPGDTPEEYISMQDNFVQCDNNTAPQKVDAVPNVEKRGRPRGGALP